VQPLISRYLLVTLALLGTLLVLPLPLPLPAARRAVVAAGFVLLTAGSLIRLRVPARALEWVLAVMVTLAVAATSLGAVFSGSGLTAPAFALRTLLACVLCALVRRRFALPVVALMVLALPAGHSVFKRPSKARRGAGLAVDAGPSPTRSWVGSRCRAEASQDGLDPAVEPLPVPAWPAATLCLERVRARSTGLIPRG